MPEKSVPPPAVKDRLDDLRRELRRRGLEAMLVTEPANVRYLSGFDGSEAALIIARRAQYLLADSRYTAQAEKQAMGFQVVRVTGKFEDAANLVRELKLRRLGYEPEGMIHAAYLRYRAAMKPARLAPLKRWLLERRAVKDRAEIKLIQKAARIAKKAFDETLAAARPGLRETEFALALENRMRELGSDPPPFPTIVASGRRGALPHGVASSKKLRAGELVTVDFGAAVAGYQSDQTITFCLGRPKKKQRELYETVREAQARAIEKIRPGAGAREVDRAARDFIARRGYADFFGHGLGHGVGLATHEEPVLNPKSKAVLEPGMVVTVEPGIYLPGFGGVRIEDMVLVTDRGHRLLTASAGPLREL